jgi:hypothetical protein
MRCTMRAAGGVRPPLAEQPLMQNVLADLALESEAATVLAMRLARCFDQIHDPAQAMLARVLTPAAKYWICKRGPGFGAEAMEVIGGSGYVEEPLARLYRELPVNSIWEGSGNVMCLDLLRAFAKSPEARDALAAELALAGNAILSSSPIADHLAGRPGARQADDARARAGRARGAGRAGGAAAAPCAGLRVVGFRGVAPEARAGRRLRPAAVGRGLRGHLVEGAGGTGLV